MSHAAVLRSQLDFGHTKVFRRDDGIIEIICGDNTHYDLEHFNEMHRACAKLCAGKRMPMLFKAGKYTSISQDALRFGATEDATILSVAEAYVINSTTQRILANFYLRIMKPKIPTRFFGSQAEAENWLKLYVFEL